MATRIVTGLRSGQPGLVLAKDEALILVPGGLIAVETGNGITGTDGKHRLSIAGDIVAEAQGIDLAGNDNLVMIGGRGSVTSGGTALLVKGSGSRFANSGEISALGSYAIDLTNIVSTDHPPAIGIVTVQNFGVIRGGIRSTGNGLNLFNSGLMNSVIEGSAVSDGLSNTGTIRGAVELAGGDDLLVNRGLISGDVSMGAAADIMDNRFGIVTGTINLGDGDDRFRPGAGDENVNGGGGIDTVDFSRSGRVIAELSPSGDNSGWADGDSYFSFENMIGSASGADVLTGSQGDNAISGLGGNDTIAGVVGNDTLSGGNGDDVVSGGIGNDVVSGDGGNDLLAGDSGADTIKGGDGKDVLGGGAGADVLVGGTGADVFYFDNDQINPASIADSTDTIKDFSDIIFGDGDRIDLSGIDANNNNVNDNAFTFIGTGAFTKAAGELRYSSVGYGVALAGDVNGDGKGDFLIKILGAVSLIAPELVL
jgi:hypothetical protein